MGKPRSKSYDIQALWFKADLWSQDTAKTWCDNHGFKTDDVRTREDDNGVVTHFIFAQASASEFKDDTFRTIADDFPEGVSASVAERKAVMDPIVKTGYQDEADPYTFVMSSQDVDRDGDIVVQDGINLKNFTRNPVALFAHDHRSPIGTWKNVRVEGRKLLGDLQLAAKGTSEFIDTLHKLIEQRILKAVSIGFSINKYEQLKPKEEGDWPGYKFTETELLECSLVAVPAQQSALRIKAAKLIPDNLMDTFIKDSIEGRPARARKAADLPRPKSARQGQNEPTHRKENKPMSIAEKIQAKQERLVAVKDRLTELKQLVGDADEELDDDQMEEIDSLSDEQESLIKSIESLQKIESGLSRKAVPAGSTRQTVPATVKKEEKGGSLLIKSMTAALIAKMTDTPVSEVINEVYGTDDRIKAVSKVYLSRTGNFRGKTAVDAADTTTPGWAAELVDNDLRGFLDELAPVSVYGRLLTYGSGLDFGSSNSVTIPRRNRSNQNNGAEIGGSWVGEGGVIPVKQMAIASRTLNRYKLAVISAFTNELMQQSVPSIEGLVRASIIEDTSLVIDSALLDDSGVVAGVRPAGLLFGVTPVASAGGTADDIITDLKALLGAMSSINGARPVLIMNSNRLLGLSTVTTAAGGFMFRDEVGNGRLLGVPVIASTTVPADEVIMIDAASFVGANASPQFAVTDQATLVMANADATAPTQAGAATDHTGGALGTEEQVPPDGGIIVTGDTTGAPAGASVAGYMAQSMFQQYQTAVRMVLPASWGLTRDGSVAALSGVDW